MEESNRDFQDDSDENDSGDGGLFEEARFEGKTLLKPKHIKASCYLMPPVRRPISHTQRICHS